MHPHMCPANPDIRFSSGGRVGGGSDLLVDFPDVVDSLIGHRARPNCKLVDAWDASCRPYLRSAITNGQWPQARLAMVPNSLFTSDNRCQLCFNAVGTLLHRSSCPATLPAGGWQKPPARCAKLQLALSRDRRDLLATRGLFLVRVEPPPPPPFDTFKWFLHPPPDIEERAATWYIDGSLFDA